MGGMANLLQRQRQLLCRVAVRFGVHLHLHVHLPLGEALAGTAHLQSALPARAIPTERVCSPLTDMEDTDSNMGKGVIHTWNETLPPAPIFF